MSSFILFWFCCTFACVDYISLRRNGFHVSLEGLVVQIGHFHIFEGYHWLKNMGIITTKSAGIGQGKHQVSEKLLDFVFNVYSFSPHCVMCVCVNV
jgi:hypothetical protein